MERGGKRVTLFCIEESDAGGARALGLTNDEVVGGEGIKASDPAE